MEFSIPLSFIGKRQLCVTIKGDAGQIETSSTCGPRLDGNRVFHKLSAIQEFQYCQLSLNCTIKNELDQWSKQPHKEPFYINWHLISRLLISHGANKDGNCEYFVVQSWTICCQCLYLWKTRIFVSTVTPRLGVSQQKLVITSLRVRVVMFYFSMK